MTVAPLVLMGGVVFMAIFGEHGLVQRHELRQRRAAIQQQIEAAALKNAALRREVRLMDKHPLGLRRAAAEELHVAPEGATIYVFEE